MDDLVAQEEKNELTQTLDSDTLERARSINYRYRSSGIFWSSGSSTRLIQERETPPEITPLMLTIQTQMLFESYEYLFPYPLSCSPVYL